MVIWVPRSHFSCALLPLPARPPMVVCKMEAQLDYRYTHCTHVFFCMFGSDLYAQSVLINKISESELSRKFTKSVLLVGYERKRGREEKKAPLHLPTTTTKKFGSSRKKGSLLLMAKAHQSKERFLIPSSFSLSLPGRPLIFAGTRTCVTHLVTRRASTVSISCIFINFQ